MVYSSPHAESLFAVSAPKFVSTFADRLPVVVVVVPVIVVCVVVVPVVVVVVDVVVVVKVGNGPGQTAWRKMGVRKVDPNWTASCEKGAALSAVAAVHDKTWSSRVLGKMVYVTVKCVRSLAKLTAKLRVAPARFITEFA